MAPKVTGSSYRRERASEAVKIGERKARREHGTPMLHTNPAPGSALHEYTHHLQAAMPGLDEHFQTLHRRRTKGERLARLPNHKAEVEGRKDQYVDAYFGREYKYTNYWRHLAPNGDAVEVMTRAVEMTFHRELLPDPVRKDPEMLDLTLGLLFRYDPPR